MFPFPLGFLWYLVSKIKLNFKVKLDVSNAWWKMFNFFFLDMCNEMLSTGWLY